MRIAYAVDDFYPQSDDLIEWLVDQGHEVDMLGTLPWVRAGRSVGEVVASGASDIGILWCHTGTGVSMAANKVIGVRAALCSDIEQSEGARRWNDANVLALAACNTSGATAIAIADAFVSTRPDEGTAEDIADLEGDNADGSGDEPGPH